MQTRAVANKQHNNNNNINKHQKPMKQVNTFRKKDVKAFKSNVSEVIVNNVQRGNKFKKNKPKKNKNNQSSALWNAKEAKGPIETYVHGIFDSGNALSRGVNFGSDEPSSLGAYRYTKSTTWSSYNCASIRVTPMNRGVAGGTIASITAASGLSSLSVAVPESYITGSDISGSIELMRHTAFQVVVEPLGPVLTQAGDITIAAYPSVIAPTQAQLADQSFLLNQRYALTDVFYPGKKYIFRGFPCKHEDCNFYATNAGFSWEMAILINGFASGSGLKVVIQEHVDLIPKNTYYPLYNTVVSRVTVDAFYSISKLMNSYRALVLGTMDEWEAALLNSGLIRRRGGFKTTYGAVLGGSAGIASAAVEMEIPNKDGQSRREAADKPMQMAPIEFDNDSPSAIERGVHAIGNVLKQAGKESICSLKQAGSEFCEGTVLDGMFHEGAKMLAAEYVKGKVAKQIYGGNGNFPQQAILAKL